MTIHISDFWLGWICGASVMWVAMCVWFAWRKP